MDRERWGKMPDTFVMANTNFRKNQDSKTRGLKITKRSVVWVHSPKRCLSSDFGFGKLKNLAK